MKGKTCMAISLVLVLTGCGPGKNKLAKGGPTPTGPSKVSTSSTPRTSSPNPSSKGTASPNASNTPKENPSAVPTSTAKISLTAKLEKKCVRRGVDSDEQGLIVQTSPGETVLFSTAYSNGTNELTNPEYKTGHGRGKADAEGFFRTTWVIPRTAPTGRAEVLVGVLGADILKLPFNVVDQTGTC